MAGGAGGRDPLVASEIQGFLTYADLNIDKLMMEAGIRWFRPNEIFAVLANYARFKVHTQPIDKPMSGTVVLYDRQVVRNFRKDGHNWKKKKDGKTVQEPHEKLKIGNEEKVHVYFARGEDDPNFFRRCYWLLDKELERIVLVHYRQTSEDTSSYSFSHLHTSVVRSQTPHIGLELVPDTGHNERRKVKVRRKKKALLQPTGSSAAVHNVGGPVQIDIDSEKTNDEAKRKEKRRQQRKCYMIWRLCLSLIGHGILFGVSFIPGFGEKTSEHHEEETSIKWLKWVVMNIIVPSVLLIVMIIIQIFVIDLDLEEEDTSQQTREDQKHVNKKNKIVNMAVVSGSKLLYVSIKEAPGPKDTLRIVAHVVAFVIDMGGALYLWWKHSSLDQEMPDSSWKIE